MRRRTERRRQRPNEHRPKNYLNSRPADNLAHLWWLFVGLQGDDWRKQNRDCVAKMKSQNRRGAAESLRVKSSSGRWETKRSIFTLLCSHDEFHTFLTILWLSCSPAVSRLVSPPSSSSPVSHVGRDGFKSVGLQLWSSELTTGAASDQYVRSSITSSIQRERHKEQTVFMCSSFSSSLVRSCFFFYHCCKNCPSNIRATFRDLITEFIT